MMFRYKNEAAFSKALCTAMRTAKWFVQRIETGSTGRGVPDIYAVTPKKKAYWIELKRAHCCYRDLHTVQWRPGQQAWLHKVTKYGQNAITLVCCDNMIVMIRHDEIYEDNGIDVIPCEAFAKIDTILKKL